MRIEVRKSAIRDLNKMDRKKREKIHEKILELAQFPEVTGVKKLTNFEPAYAFGLVTIGSCLMCQRRWFKVSVHTP